MKRNMARFMSWLLCLIVLLGVPGCSDSDSNFLWLLGDPPPAVEQDGGPPQNSALPSEQGDSDEDD